MVNLLECPTTGLLLPGVFVDEKASLKKVIDQWLEEALNATSNVKDRYFITLKARFNKLDSSQFEMSSPIVTKVLPPFCASSFVWWVCPKSSICELLWMVAPSKKGQKLKVEFNQKGVAYLQSKGAMPK